MTWIASTHHVLDLLVVPAAEMLVDRGQANAENTANAHPLPRSEKLKIGELTEV